MKIYEIVNQLVEEYIDCMTDAEMEEIIRDAMDYDEVNRELTLQLEAHVENCISAAVESYLDDNLR